QDYFHELVCISEEERIVVPIRAIAARAVLDFPDRLDFSECPIKYTTQKTLLVRNSGNEAAHYQLSTQSHIIPFSGKTQARGFPEVSASDAQHELCCGQPVHIRIKLHGSAEDVNIGLSAYSMKVEAFITMSNHATVFIRNRSNITAHFQWKRFPTDKADNTEKRRLCDLLRPSTKVWVENYMKEKKIKEETGFCEDHTALLSKKVEEEMAKVQEDPLLFSSDVFFIEPMEGEIRPHCSAEIKVTFKPLEALDYQTGAYCSISGRESRLPLCLRGKGQGPLLEFSSDTLNLRHVFVASTHVREVTLINKGAIDAPFTYIPSTSDVGNCFKLVPEEGIIAPGGIQTLRIIFNATVLGYFEE
ncbi:HYDIN protein, partial [Brachypodius atriceps]|nr:HYDIN protein [Brachypodius atriceps]